MKKSKFFALLTIFCYLHSLAFGLPAGEQVVSGTADFDRSNPSALTITTPSEKLITNYQVFDIATNEAVRFVQPSSDSIALNRVVSSDVSEIFGALSANGRIFLINPNGVTFGPDCRIDTPGIVASTLDISDSDFLSGKYSFFKTAGKNGLLYNQADLKVSNGGFIILLAPGIVNQGAISAPLGTVALAGGDKATLSLDDMSDISVVIDDAVREEMTGPDGNELDSAIRNNGAITADGGRIIITSAVLNHIFNYAINNTGIIEAQTLVDKNGIIELVAQGAAILTSGIISANAPEGGKAGSVSIVSDEGTAVAGGSLIEAKAEGQSGTGGTIFIDSTAGDTIVSEGAVIDVSGGAAAGDAGFAEISASDAVGFYGTLNGFAQ
ncbi:MAG: filamentous hemagglutinin N-terminal domain-containing protein, partial [Candidatus Omnitrophica bacterium]|nr:filamentous hemagglutinin N-terminal domain-containing protein [Candidatus Omnitrophota bacterium]